MMESNEIDLEGKFDIYIVDWDGVMSLGGYSVSVIPGPDNSVRLVKNACLSEVNRLTHDYCLI
jgi:hypothetical protein